jgi:hypothetical protein
MGDNSMRIVVFQEYAEPQITQAYNFCTIPLKRLKATETKMKRNSSCAKTQEECFPQLLGTV